MLARAGHGCESILLTQSCDATLAAAVPTLFGAGASMAGYGKRTVGFACATSCIDAADPKWVCDPNEEDVYVMEGHNIIAETIHDLVCRRPPPFTIPSRLYTNLQQI